MHSISIGKAWENCKIAVVNFYKGLQVQTIVMVTGFEVHSKNVGWGSVYVIAMNMNAC